MKKRAFCLFLAAALSLSALCACTAGTTGVNGDSSAGVSISTPSKGKNAMSSRLVGISMPEQAGRWEQEATTMQTILQAKDYMVFKLTGRFCTDYSDAGGTESQLCFR